MQINANPHLQNVNPQVQSYPQRLYRTVVNGTLLNNVTEGAKAGIVKGFEISGIVAGIYAGDWVYESAKRLSGEPPSIPLLASECSMFKDSPMYNNCYQCEESFWGFSGFFDIGVVSIPLCASVGYVAGFAYGIGKTVLTA